MTWVVLIVSTIAEIVRVESPSEEQRLEGATHDLEGFTELSA
jgi:hypothetical protein